MKKHLLIAATLVLSGSGFAQSARKAALNKPVKTNYESVVPEGPATLTPKKASGHVNQPENTPCTSRFTACVNAFAVGGGVTTYVQNCLSYNQDLNAILWMSRVSADWSFTGKTSGAIQATWYDLTTHTGDSMIIWRDSSNNVHGARYPGGVLFNPAGNTTMAGAYLAGSGPVTSNGTPAWIGEWYRAVKPTGNYHNPLATPAITPFVAAGTSPFGNAGNGSTNAGFFNQDMCQVGQKVMVTGALWDYTAPAEVKGAVIGIGTYSGGSFTWTADSIEPGFLNTNQGLINDFRGARMAFDPSGTIGYLVFNGRLSTNYNNSSDSTMMPIVYKTTDSGTTWNGPVLPGYDWSKEHPELLKNVGALLATPGHRVTPNTQHGIDLTVDANGVLHYVTTLTMPFKDGDYFGGGFDSLQFTYTYKWDYVDNHPIIWDLMTDGTCWKTMMVDSIITSYVGSDPASDTTASFSSWQNASTFLPYGAHITVSRSTDGKMVFYGWGDSDPNVSGNNFNGQPDIKMVALDVTSNSVSPTIPATNGLGVCFFSYLSDISYYDNSLGAWVVPFMYTVGRAGSGGVYDGTAAVDYYYGTCASFNGTNVNVPAVINNEAVNTGCTINVKSQSSFAASVNSYPNPFSSTTNIVVNLHESKAFDLKVYDAIGNLVWSKKTQGVAGENTVVFDGTSLSPGVYYYTLSSGTEKVARKLVLQK